MFELLNAVGFLYSLLVSGLIELRTDSGSVMIDFADAPVAVQVQTKDVGDAELEFSSGPEGVKVFSGQYEILLPVEFKKLTFKNNQLQIVRTDGGKISVEYRPNILDSGSQPDLKVESLPITMEAEAKSKTAQPPEKSYQFADFSAAVNALAELSPHALYAESEAVLLTLARSLPPESLRSRKQEAIQLKAAVQLLMTFIKQQRTSRSQEETRILVASIGDEELEDVVSVSVTPATLAFDLLRMIGLDSPEVRALLFEEMQQVLFILPKATGAHGWSGWTYSVAEDTSSAKGGQLGVLAALAAADKKTVTKELTHLNTLLRTWEELTGRPMTFDQSPADTLHSLFGGLAIEKGSDQEKYRYLPQVTAFDDQPFDRWISIATHGAKSPLEFQRLMIALKAGGEHKMWISKCAEVRTEIIRQTLRDFEPNETWYQRMRSILSAGVSEAEAQRVVNLIREQSMETQAALLSNILARWRTIRVSRDSAPADGSAETTVPTDFQVLEAAFHRVEDNNTGIMMSSDSGPFATLIHEDIDRFDTLPKDYQNALMPVFQSQQGLWKAHKLLRQIANTEGHPRRLEATMVLVHSAFSDDPIRDSIPTVVMHALVDRAPENQWLDAASYFRHLQGDKYSEETALRLVELILADTKSGDIRPLRVRIPEPLTTNHDPLLPPDYVADSYHDVVISRRIILASVLATTLPESQQVRDRIALALAEALSAEVLDEPSPFRQSDVPEELLFRLADARFRVASSKPDNGNSGVESNVANQVFKNVMNRLLQSSDWRASLKQLQSIPHPEPTGKEELQ